jgi:radical SAM superfamily enzyme YgiQ (UPF0313 family)
MKKILLVRTGKEKHYPPMGLLSIAPYFKDAEVTIYDLWYEHLETNYRIDFKQFDVLGLSGFTSQLFEMDNMAKLAKAYNPNIRVVAGGSGVTSSPQFAKEMLKNCDLLIDGDGEEFAENWQTYIDYNVVFKTKRFDWKGYMLPKWDLINYKQYLKTSGFGVETSRGCPFNCVFCTAKAVHGRIWRPREPESVVQEIANLKKHYGCKLFYFPDDNATVDPKRWVELMQQIVDAKLNIRLHVPEGIQAHHLDYETLYLMKKAGFRNIYIGAESGCDRILDKVIEKGGLTTQQIELVVKQGVDLGLTMNCFFVIGIVGETLAEAKQTVNFAEKMRKLGAYDCTVRNAIPIQGTRMYDIAKEKGYIVGEFNNLNSHQNKHLLHTPEWSPKQIEDLVALAAKQQAQHIFRRKKMYMLKKGIPMIFSNPKKAFNRLNNLNKQLKS